MVVLATLGGSVSVTEGNGAKLRGSVEITGTGPFVINVTIDRAAEIAGAQRFRRLGVRLDINGSTMPDREIGKVLTITESADTFGDQLTFQLVGARFSPFGRALLRTRALVEVWFTYGSPGGEFTGKVFTGRVVSHTFDIGTNTANVTALDAAGFYAMRKAESYALGPNHGKSRLTITQELLAIGGIPIRYIDLGGDGGTGRKPLTLGDRPILEFLRDYLAILGAEIGFEDGGFVARRYNASLPAVLELNPGNLITGLTATVPDNISPNVTGVVSTSFTRTEPTGIRGPVVTSIITVAPYAPIAFETGQNGEFTYENPAGIEAPSPRIVSELETATTYFGSLDVRTEETEKTWYAARAARQQIQSDEDPPGYTVTNRGDRQVYIYPDGSTRAVPKEQFQLTRKMIRVKTTNIDRNVIRSREERYSFKMRRKALWLNNGSEDVLQASPSVKVDDEGNGVIDGEENFRLTEVAETSWKLNADGTINEEKLFEAFFSIGQERRIGLSARGYGIEERTYTSLAEELMAVSESSIGAANAGGWRLTTKRYRVLDEDRYEVTEVIRDMTGTPKVTTSRVTGALPRPERAEAEQSSQEVRATVYDGQRISLVGEEILAVEHNEFVETNDEARAFATYKARLAGAMVLSCETPIEALLHKFRCVTINIPHASIDGLKFYVRSIARDAATFRQAVTADYYPPSI